MAAPANEIEEPAPSSSRRPIAEEVAYGEQSSPRHTPPPESGKQVAVPSGHPSGHSSGRPSATSIPPDSLEPHTLIGGWREPGLGVPGLGIPVIAPAPSGVRLPTSPPQRAPMASGTRLSPDVTRPDLPEGRAADVASFEGAPALAPTTLGELLDWTLAL